MHHNADYAKIEELLLMVLIRRQKITIALLVLYWITLVVLTHIPIPKLVYQAQVSDKWLHFLGYINLVFLLWFTIYPESRVNWRSRWAWLILLAAVVYGGLDELSQPYFDRSCDIEDFIANAAGIMAGLVIFTFLSFWRAIPMVLAITIFGLTNLVHTDLSKLVPVGDAVFHIFAYGGFALIWAKFMDLYLPRRTFFSWLLMTLAGPACLLLVVKGGSVLLGRPFAATDLLFAILGIIAATAARGVRYLPKGL
jgi:VanZ family protein